jgi:hypothetical protein
VLDISGAELRGNRKSQPGRQRCSRVRRLCDAPEGQRQAERCQNAAHFLSCQPAIALAGGRRPADGPRIVNVKIVESPQESGCLIAPFRVRRRLAQRPRGVFRKGISRQPFATRVERYGAASFGHQTREHRLAGSAGAPRGRYAVANGLEDGWRRLRVHWRHDDDERVDLGRSQHRLDGLPILVSAGDETMSMGLPKPAVAGRCSAAVRGAARSSGAKPAVSMRGR